MNTKLLRKVQKHILAEPRRLDMNVLGYTLDVIEKTDPPCGTVGCIAGWAALLQNEKWFELSNAEKEGLMDWTEGETALKLTTEEAHRLFIEPKYAETEIHAWPLKFATRYLKAKTPRQRAKVTSDRIDHFIKTKGRE